MKTHLTKVSSNKKTGPIPVTTSSRATCPDSCALKRNGCYADNYHLGMHWDKVTKGERGLSWEDFLSEIKALPRHQLWRHNQAGDLAGVGDSLDVFKLAELTKANKGKNGFTYTHKKPTERNLKAIRAANGGGFTINLSANNLAHADKIAGYGVPVVAVIPEDSPKKQRTKNGRLVITCPAQLSDKINCARCGLCANADRDYIIGFPAHGTAKKKANIIARSVA